MFRLMQSVHSTGAQVNMYLQHGLWCLIKKNSHVGFVCSGERLVFALSLHSILCNFSCQDSPILDLLTFHTPCLPLVTAPQRNFAVQAASNNINLVRKATTGINASSGGDS